MKRLLFMLIASTTLTVQSYGQTLDEIRAKAKEGDAMYQAVLGQCYRAGLYGLTIDTGEAKKWIAKNQQISKDKTFRCKKRLIDLISKDKEHSLLIRDER
jgi:hypothetical protein